ELGGAARGTQGAIRVAGPVEGLGQDGLIFGGLRVKVDGFLGVLDGGVGFVFVNQRAGPAGVGWRKVRRGACDVGVDGFGCAPVAGGQLLISVGQAFARRRRGRRGRGSGDRLSVATQGRRRRPRLRVHVLRHEIGRCAYHQNQGHYQAPVGSRSAASVRVAQ